MGLLDQVLGQVIGNLGGGAQGRPGPAGGGGGLGDILGQVLGGARGGAPQPAPRGEPAPPSGQGGGLGDLLAGAGGKFSPLILAVLAILANKHMSSGAGGLGSVLHDMLGGGSRREERQPEDGAGYEPGTEGGREPDGYMGDDGYGEPPPGMQIPPEQRGGGMRGGSDGGFLNDVGSMLDGPGGRQQQGGDGGAFGGFDDLQRRFDQNGQGDLMGSWIGPGANREAAPGDLERALGSGTIDELSRRFGLERGELLDQLSRALPQVVDGLTPQGRAPTREEQRGWL